MNFGLRLAIQKARDSNMPSINIERAIKKSTGADSGADQMQEVIYEGYGPGGAAILLQVLTDNKNRTVSDVRSTFTKIGGNLAEAGAGAWAAEFAASVEDGHASRTMELTRALTVRSDGGAGGDDVASMVGLQELTGRLAGEASEGENPGNPSAPDALLCREIREWTATVSRNSWYYWKRPMSVGANRFVIELCQLWSHSPPILSQACPFWLKGFKTLGRTVESPPPPRTPPQTLNSNSVGG